MISKRISVFLPTLLIAFCALFLCACGEQEREAPDLTRSNIVVVDRTITINGFEDALYSKDSGATWQEENVFAELTYDSTYGICVKYPRTREYLESPMSNVIDIQIVKAPATTPVILSSNVIVSGNKVEITGFTNAQYSADDGKTWSNNNVFSNLLPGHTYSFRVRIMETENTAASAISRAYNVTIEKAEQDAPLLDGDNVALNQSVLNIVVNGYENANLLYSCDGGQTSQASRVFSNLTPGQTYAICIKYPETDTQKESPWSNIIYRTFDKISQITPVLSPSNLVQEDHSLRIVGFEDNNASFSIDGGLTWSEAGENVFTNLVVGQSYQVRVRFLETATHYASSESAIYTFTMQKIPQTAPVLTLKNIEQDGTTVTITGFENAEYSLDGADNGWSDNNVFTNLTYDQTYKFFVRFKASTDYIASPASSIEYKIIKASQDAPVIDVSMISQDGHTLTITPFENASYSINGGETWLSSNVFSDLTIGTTYSISVMYNENESQYASEMSNIVEFTLSKLERRAPTLTLENISQSEQSLTISGFNSGEVMYSIDGGANWSENNVFTGLALDADYMVTVKYVENDEYLESPSSAPVTFRMNKLAQTAPELTLDNIVQDEYDITIAGFEDNATTVQYKLGEGEWQESNQFTGLTLGQSYTVYVKFLGNEVYLDSEEAQIEFTMAKFTQTALVLVEGDITQDGQTLTIKTFENASYSINNGDSWQAEPVFEGLTLGTEYQVVVKFNETEIYAESLSNVIVFTMEKLDRTAPELTQESNISLVGNVLTVIGFEDEDVSYRFNEDGEWSSTNTYTFEGSGMVNVYVKYNETEIYKESISEPLSVIYTAPEETTYPISASTGGKVEITNDEGDTVTAVATADENYKFVEWQNAEGSQIETSTTLTIAKAELEGQTITAIFRESTPESTDPEETEQPDTEVTEPTETDSQQ